MKILSLRDAKHSNSIDTINIADDERSLFILSFNNTVLTGRNVHYPNCLIQTEGKLVNPYDERVMSLNKDSFYEKNEFESKPYQYTNLMSKPCFFFIYNVDNYFHYIYDTLPLLYSYFLLKEKLPDLTLLLQTSHPSKKHLAPFITEFLKNLGIETFEFAQSDTCYTSLYVSSSFTHGGQSNDPPSSLCFSVWNRFLSNCTKPLPKRFYISRRSWIHGKTENMGTNYTTRRKCMNEDSVVELLKDYNIEEVFTELLTTDEKIALFSQAELIVGIVGGGMCNLLFSTKETKSLCIATPHFLDINNRFQYSMNHTNILYSNSASLYPYRGIFPLYSRIKVKETGRVGEVEAYETGYYKITLSSNDVAGFSQDFPMETVWLREDSLEPVDKGLNSPFEVCLEQLETDLKNLLSK
jgi:hypothetical protein